MRGTVVLLGALMFVVGACAHRPSVGCPTSSDSKTGFERKIGNFDYAIDGRTPTELSASMKKRAPFPRGSDDEVAAIGFAACPRWQLQPTAGGRCKLEPMWFYVELLYVLPKWTSREGASPETLTWWANEERRILIHETGHVAIADEETKAMYEQLTAITEAASCEELNQLLNTRFDELGKKLIARQVEYDRTTQHGLTQ